jgi:RNA polymerase sigma-70 factor (ECF subfamily)
LPERLEKYNDGELVRAILAGRDGARGILVDRYLKSVYSVVFPIVGRETDAEDLVQDTFLHAFERLDRYDETYSLRNWLLKMATNLTLSYLRTRRRERQLEHDFANTKMKWQDEPVNVQEGAFCRDLLEQLDADQRTALVLFHFEQVPYAEVARVMNIPVNTVRTLLHRGRKRLRELISRQEAKMESDV